MVALPWLEPGDPFPPPQAALDDPPGLLAAGGDLSTTTLLNAYQAGIFPWFNPGEPPLWWSPDPRLVLLPESFHCSRSLGRLLRRDQFLFSLNTCFPAVIEACARVPRRGQAGTWIVPAMREAYTALHRMGHAHSVEVWHESQLVGGLYGVQLGRAFFGESMFSLASNASKSALAALTALSAPLRIELIDCQVESPHLLTLGATCWPRERFLSACKTLTARPAPRWPRLSPTPYTALANAARLAGKDQDRAHE